MITISNYQTEKQNIDWSSMPKQISDARGDIDDIIEFYNDDSDIKETVDLFFKGINDNAKKAVENKAASKPTPKRNQEKAAVSNLTEFKKWLKDNIGQTMYLDSTYQGNRKLKERRIVKIVQSNSVAFAKSEDTKPKDYSWLTFGKASDWTFSNRGAMFRDDWATLIYHYEKPNDWEETTRIEKEEATEMTIRQTMAATKYLKNVMNSYQQQALFALESSEEKEFFIKKIQQLDEILDDARKIDDKTPVMDKIVKMHFFYGGSDWYIFDYTPADNLFFGYVVLNGDTQMSEAGYISVDELKSIKGIEMDFYFKQQELGKILHKTYPDEFPAYEKEAEQKPAQQPAKAKVTKTKVAVALDKKVVDNYSVEYQLIRRFWNLIKNENNIIIPFRSVQLLYMAFNKAAVERKVRKTSTEADLFTDCNKKINILFEEFENPNQQPYEVDFTDKKLYNEIKEFATGFTQNKAIPVLKRYIGMQNTMPDVKKAATLLKSINKIIETDNSNRLLSELSKAASSLEKYLAKPKTSLPLAVYGLSVPRNICTNRIKCTGVDKSGKLHKGYKFQEHTGHVIKVKSQKVSKKKANKKKKNVGSLGYLDSNYIEKIYTDETQNIIPISPVENEPEIENKNEVEQVAPIEAELVTSKAPSNKLMRMQFESLEMDNGWEELMQDPAANMKIAIFGPPKNGKTAGSLQLANYLTKFGNVLYNFADQGFNLSTQKLWIESGLSKNPKAEPSDINTLAELDREIAKGKYKFVFIDMISDYIRLEKIKPEEFKANFMRKYPKVSFILIFEVTKAGTFKGDEGWMHVVDAIMNVEHFVIANRGRYGFGKRVIWEQGFADSDPKGYAEWKSENTELILSPEVEKI